MKPATLAAALLLLTTGIAIGHWWSSRTAAEREHAESMARTHGLHLDGDSPSSSLPPTSNLDSLTREPLHALTLTARLADRATNAPLPDAELALVELSPAPPAARGEAPIDLEKRPLTELGRARTDADGRVLLTLSTTSRDLAALPLAIALTAPGHAARMQRLDLVASPTGLLDLGWLFLDATPTSGARVTGLLLDRRSAPVADALLLLGSDPLYPLADARLVGRTRATGELALDALVTPSDRTTTQHLFALAPEGLAWAQVRVADDALALDVGTLTLAPSARVSVRVVDEEQRPVGGARVEARARFYPLSGLFDAREPGFVPDDRVLARFVARTNGFGDAVFEGLPVPFASGLYEFASDEPGLGAGSALAEELTPDAGIVVVLRR